MTLFLRLCIALIPVLAVSPGAGAGTPGRFTNPIGGAIRMGDPFILAEAGQFHLYGTTAVNEGFRCWSSTNWTDWTDRGLAYRKSASSWGGKNFWAPEVIKRGDRYFMAFSCEPATNRAFSTRICLAVSRRPEGPFEDFRAPLFDNGWACIDAHLFVDADGTPYLFFDKVGVIDPPPRRYLSGIIYGVKLAPDLSGVVGEPVLCLQADQAWELPEAGRSRCNEGAFVFKHHDTYYLTYSANHYEEPIYGIGYATAKSPLGPWRKAPDNPLVSRRPDLGVSGPGHNCVLHSADGRETIMVYHAHADASRPGGGRTVNLDRLLVQPDGRLRLVGPTRTPQLLPAGF